VRRRDERAGGGVLTRRVIDATGAPLPNAEIAVLTRAGQPQKQWSEPPVSYTWTDSAGYFLITELPAGVYDIGVRLAGFKTETRADVHVGLAPATANFELQFEPVTCGVDVRPRLNRVNRTLSRFKRFFVKQQSYADRLCL
jgi:hypothetical protein